MWKTIADQDLREVAVFRLRARLIASAKNSNLT
jgi:hypothetical protein